MDESPKPQRLRSISELEARAASQAAIGCFLLVLGSLLVGFWFLAASGDVTIVGSWSTIVLIVALLAAVAGAIAFWLMRRFSAAWLTPMAVVNDVLDRAVGGDTAARTHMISDDPIGRLGRAVDVMLEQRVQVQSNEALVSEQLNNSVVDIMQAVGEIATTKNLSLKVPVTEDVTGAIADAVNLLTEETGRVLNSVARVARNVATAAKSVRSQADSAAMAAGRERHEVELAARELGRAAAALNAIAERARHCNDVAEQALKTTVAAVRQVGETVKGVAQSRDLIRETEKRVKRLGERSQEIGQIVAIIQGIAERTGILALNASMHAIAAGEAGRSFVSVADQVKRLSESAKDATEEIGRLVIAIQNETGETVIAMNEAITKVVEINQLADGASHGMRQTQERTEQLAASVREIARTSIEQAKVGAGLQERARIIQEASSETARQLSSQAIETRRLAEYANTLTIEVSVFKLPGVDVEAVK